VTGTLVLLRHGESTWNRDNLFTGWVDVELSDKGRAEAVAAGRVMAQEGLLPDVVHTSLLKRAIHTANLTLAEIDRDWIPVRRSWRLNERHYGALQGLNKKQTVEKHGEDEVMKWRRSYNVRPPALDHDDPMHPRFDVRYADVPERYLPTTECLEDVIDRMLPHYEDVVIPDLRDGHCTLIAAHGNSLRALVKELENIPDEDIVDVNIPTGVPRVYRFDEGLGVTEARYLGDPAAIEAAAQAVADQA
jgi:2,3-bisphosphoglycerate-dependent phosphoglycerate mutase